MKALWSLFVMFFKIGAFTFGGGYSMVPIIQHEISEKRRLIEEEEMSTIIVLAQSLPGVLAVNMATLVGYKLFQKRGALICALGVVLPSFLIIIFLADLIIKYGNTPQVSQAFSCIRAVVVGMILAAAVKLGKPCYGHHQQMVILVVALGITLCLDLHPIILIGLGGVAGWVLSRQNQPKKGDNNR